MAKTKHILCRACGHNNDAAASKNRCAGCGASLEPSARPETAPESRYSTRPFSFLWLAIALVVLGVLTGAVVVGLPMVVHALDFEGSAGSLVAIPVWFCGGLLVGLISPEKTFAEPAVATFLIAMPTVAFLVESQTVKTQPLFMYILMAVLGVVFALVGAYTGERLQQGPKLRRR